MTLRYKVTTLGKSVVLWDFSLVGEKKYVFRVAPPIYSGAAGCARSAGLDKDGGLPLFPGAGVARSTMRLTGRGT